MAKELKTTKDKLVMLFNVIEQVPVAKLTDASSTAKHLGFRKAVKKMIVKDYIDVKAEKLEEVTKKQKELAPKFEPIQKRLKEIEAIEKTPELEEEIKKLGEEKSVYEKELTDYVNKANEFLNGLMDTLKTKKVVVVFDNEDFLFEKNLIKDNVSELFKNSQGKLNADQAELIFDLLDSIE